MSTIICNTYFIKNQNILNLDINIIYNLIQCYVPVSLTISINGSKVIELPVILYPKTLNV